MDKYTLPTSVMIDNVECEFNSDFRDILEIFKVLSDPDLLDIEKVAVAFSLFYKDDKYSVNPNQAMTEMFSFINMKEPEEHSDNNQKPLYDWEQDFNIIVAPVNKILGFDCRGKEYLHWWTFLSAFMDIGECTFSTYVAIRDKLNRGKKLEKYEEKIYKDNKDKILLKKKVDTTTQSLMDEIMGV